MFKELFLISLAFSVAIANEVGPVYLEYYSGVDNQTNAIMQALYAVEPLTRFILDDSNKNFYNSLDLRNSLPTVAATYTHLIKKMNSVAPLSNRKTPIDLENLDDLIEDLNKTIKNERSKIPKETALSDIMLDNDKSWYLLSDFSGINDFLPKILDHLLKEDIKRASTLSYIMVPQAFKDIFDIDIKVATGARLTRFTLSITPSIEGLEKGIEKYFNKADNPKIVKLPEYLIIMIPRISERGSENFLSTTAAKSPLMLDMHPYTIEPSMGRSMYSLSATVLVEAKKYTFSAVTKYNDKWYWSNNDSITDKGNFLMPSITREGKYQRLRNDPLYLPYIFIYKREPYDVYTLLNLSQDLNMLQAITMS